jgi:hypothetical protein
MKKQIQIDKLSLDKETVSRLDEEQLKNFLGGGVPDSISCNKPAALEEDEELGWNSCCNNSCN